MHRPWRWKKSPGMPLWITILASGALTTIYTALGGMRAVIWTDVMQLIVLFGGQLMIVIVALGKIPGGLGGMWETVVADGRMDLSMSFSVSERVNLGGIRCIAGRGFSASGADGHGPGQSVQRYLSAGSLKESAEAPFGSNCGSCCPCWCSFMAQGWCSTPSTRSMEIRWPRA